jgi:hypothetical protein
MWRAFILAHGAEMEAEFNEVFRRMWVKRNQEAMAKIAERLDLEAWPEERFEEQLDDLEHFHADRR